MRQETLDKIIDAMARAVDEFDKAMDIFADKMHEANNRLKENIEKTMQ